MGPVAGPRGEISKDFVHLLRQAAKIGAIRVGQDVPVSADTTAEAILRWHAMCRIGLVAQRASARHIIDRLAYAMPGGAYHERTDAAREATFGTGDPSDIVDNYRLARYADGGASDGSHSW